MKRKILFILTLLGGAWVGLLMQHDPGYVLISYKHTTIESTLWFASAFLCLSFIAISLALRSSFGFFAIPRKLDRWFKARKKDQVHDNTLKGIQYLIQGDWDRAEKKLGRLARHHEQHHLINLLFAAKAASRRGDQRQRDDHLKMAFEQSPQDHLAILLTQAQLQLEHYQQEQALATLKQLHHNHPQHLWVATQLANLYFQLREWPSLASLMPLLKRHKCIDTDTLVKMEVRAYSDLFKRATTIKDLTKYWRSTSKEAQQNHAIIKAYCNKLIALDHAYDAAKALKKHLSKHWSDDLLALYQPLSQAKPLVTLKTLLLWQKTHTDCPALLCQIGLCYLAQELPGKAREMFHQCVRLDSQQKQAWQSLSTLAENDNDLRQALHYLRQSIYEN